MFRPKIEENQDGYQASTWVEKKNFSENVMKIIKPDESV